MKRLILFLVAAISIETVTSQTVTVHFRQLAGILFPIEHILEFDLINTGPSQLPVSIEIDLMQNGISQIVQGAIAGEILATGVNSFGLSKFNQTVFQYGNSASAQHLASTGFLLPGSYSLCIEIKGTGGNTVGFSCNEILVDGYLPPHLLYPENNAIIYTENPILQWTTIMPGLIKGVEYRLELWKSQEIGMRIGNKLIDERLANNVFTYSGAYPQLVSGEQYQWRISAFINNYHIVTTEFWSFSIGGPESVAKEIDEQTDSYRILSLETKNMNFTAEGILRIGYNNMTGDSLFSYRIAPIDTPDLYYAELPEIILAKGLNRLEIPLDSTGYFIDSKYYILEAWDANDRWYYLKFYYIEP